MYDTADPRSALQTSAPVATGADIADPEFFDFTELSPDHVTDKGSVTWICRGQNFVLSHIRPVIGDVITNQNQDTERMVLLAQDTSAVRVETDNEQRTRSGMGLLIIPPGQCRIIAEGAGELAILHEPHESIVDIARNGTSYAKPHPRVAPLTSWPAPPDGDRIRAYALADIPDDPGRFGRIFRSRSFMVNFLQPFDGPRDPHNLSPHHHDDFEQCSLAVQGSFLHHIRTPWQTDKTRWRADVHHEVSSPSVAIIPPPTVHTTEAVGTGRNQLIDIFSPPRADFSAQPGWVLNAEEYPQP